MKINTSLDRWLHLFVLFAFTGIGGFVLIHYLEWTPLTAFGVSCTVTCQVNSLLRNLSDDDETNAINNKSIDDGAAKKQKSGKKKTRQA
jgi:hypothetical protein